MRSKAEAEHLNPHRVHGVQEVVVFPFHFQWDLVQ